MARINPRNSKTNPRNLTDVSGKFFVPCCCDMWFPGAITYKRISFIDGLLGLVMFAGMEVNECTVGLEKF